jgi:isoleucyl-tRNA synthetase
MSIDFPKEEEAVLARWKEINAFERQVHRSPWLMATWNYS